jgi:hypothetical protein
MTKHSAVTEIPKTAAVSALTTKAVHITDRNGHVDQPQIHLSEVANDQVAWFAHANENATIVFTSSEGSPFQSSFFQIPAGGSVCSGAIRAGAKYQSYKYSVVAPAGVTDPEVIINR